MKATRCPHAVLAALILGTLTTTLACAQTRTGGAAENVALLERGGVGVALMAVVAFANRRRRA
jgi:hypothetical protein